MSFIHVPFLGDLSRLQFGIIFGSIGLWLLVYVPLSIYHFSKYYKKRNNAIYRARYASITIYSVVFVVIKIIFDCYDIIQYALIKTADPSLYIDYLDIGNSLLVYLVIYSWIWRIWMISYEIIWTNCMMNDEWKRIINASYLADKSHSIYTMNNKKTNWYLSKKITYGNYKWVKWRLLIIVILSFGINAFCDIYAALYLSDDTFYFYLTVFAGLIPMILPYILLIIIYCITPKYEGDNFYILTEIKYIMFCLFIDYFISYGAYTLFFAFYNPKFNESNNIAIIATNISFHIGVLSQFLGLLISTMWVNKKVLKIVNSSRFKEVTTRRSYVDYGDDQSINSKLIKVHPAEKKNDAINGDDDIYYFDKIKLKHVLRHELSLELFINHLYSEFCIECILSLIEFLQFQQYVAQCINFKNNINNKNDEKLLCELIIFHESIPKSQIVFNQKNGNNLKQKAYRLYNKYINEDTAEYEINISFDVRKNITNLMQNIDKIDINDIELMNIFNNCCKQMINLMKDSFSRFKTSTQYQQIVKNIYNQNIKTSNIN